MWAWRTGSWESYFWIVLLANAFAHNAMESGSYLVSTSWLLLLAAMFVAWRPGRARLRAEGSEPTESARDVAPPTDPASDSVVVGAVGAV